MSKKKDKDAKLAAQGALLIEESLGEVSANNSRLSTSGRKRSLYLSDIESDLEAVNNAQERKERRNLEAIEKARRQSITKTKSKDQPPVSVLSTLTDKEIDTHYFQCLDLFSQNKVNLKNAFKLQLIDFMKMTLANKSEKSENLTLMSCTLDASAKIYSCRVDKVYSDMLKYLSGKDLLNEGKNDGKQNGDDEVNDGESGERGDTPQAKKKKKKSKQNDDEESGDEQEDEEYQLSPPSKFVRDSSSFQRKDIDHIFYGDILPRNQEYFLSCPIKGSSYEIALNKPLFENEAPCSACDKVINNLGALSATEPDNDRLEEYIPGYSELSSKFEVVQTSTEDKNQMDSSFTYDSKVHGVSAATINEGNESDGEGNDGGEPLLDYDEDEFQAELTIKSSLGAAPVSEAERLRSNSLPTKVVENQNLSFAPSSLARMLRSASSEYSLFDNSKLQFMTGATHWKIKPIKDEKKSVIGKTPLKGVRKSQYLNFNFNQLKKDLEIGTFEEDIKKLTIKTIGDWNHNRGDLVLSKDIEYSQEKLISCFKHQICFLIKSKEGFESQHQDMNESIALTQNEFMKNNNDDIDDDHFGDEPAELDDFCAPLPDEAPSAVSSLPQCDETTVTSQVQPSDQSLLVPSKMKVEKISIKYAKKQKRIDIRMLKETMWDIINSDDRKENIDNLNGTNNESRPNGFNQGLKFSSVFKQVVPKLPDEMADDLEMPTAFLSLLFLANEKNLRLKNDGPDIDISFE